MTEFKDDHFDEAAQARMAEGSASLAPWLEKYQSKVTGPCVEFGPFLNPVLQPLRFPSAEITFVDGDASSLQILKDRYAGQASVHCVHFDLSGPTAKLLTQLPNRFNAIVVSQVLNYVDFHRFMTTLLHVANAGAYLFINNIAEYGIPELFSPDRALDDAQILSTLPRFGWEVVESQQIPSTSERHENPRLLLVAKKRVA